MTGFEDDLKNSLEVLRNGGVILYPTDTVWGLGCDPTNPGAVDKLLKIKSRTESKSLIILVNGITMLERYVKDIPAIVYELTEVSVSPLTIIYPVGKNLASGICAKDSSVAVRICDEQFCNELISRFRKPVVSTSANLSGAPSPANFEEVDPELVKKADYAVRYRREEKRKFKPSPVIRVENNGVIKIIRK
jgi:L-threonylcarbamoyladenylate synthase